MASHEAPAGRRRALLIATATYGDPGLAALRAPTGDVAALAHVLGDAAVGGFDVDQLVDQPTEELRQRIETFFGDGRPQDLLLLYVSGHGVLSQSRRFYFATATTSLALLRSTAIEDSFVNDVMQGSRARSIVLVLDCCHSGAFGKGLAPKSATTVDVEHRFEGQGRVTLSASTELEYAFEEAGPSGISELEPAAPGSLFTRSVVEGLRTGDADIDEDGRISVDDLYDYVCRRVRERSVHQTPGMAGDMRGDITIARSRRRAELPPELAGAVASNLTGIREGAVGELKAMLGSGGSAAAAARTALERLADDDSRRVASAAQAALGRARPVAPPPAEPPAPAQEPSEPPGRKWRPRRRWVAIAAAVAGLAAVAGVVVAGLGGGSQPPAGPAAPYAFYEGGGTALVVGVPNGAEQGNEGTPGVVLVGATSDPQVVTGSRVGVPGKVEPDERFGAAVASADFDRDGLADLAIGVPGKDGIAVIYGLDDERMQWIGASNLQHKPLLKDFGAGLVAADFNHDGYGDLAVSAPGDRKQREAWDSATIHIIFGGAHGLRTTGDTRIEQSGDFKEFGLVMAAGDIDGDGQTDLVEGSPGNPAGGAGGHLSVCTGGPDGPTACGPTRSSPTTSLAVGHIDGDRFADVAQGYAGAGDDVGVLRVWLGRSSGLENQPVRIDQHTKNVPGDPVSRNVFGSAVAVAELTGDHFDDIVVSALGDNDGSGTVSVIPGSSDGARPVDAYPVPVTGITSGHFGAPLSTLKWDGDAHADLFVGVTDAATLDGSLVYYVSDSEGGLKLQAQHASGLDKQTQTNAQPELYIGR